MTKVEHLESIAFSEDIFILNRHFSPTKKAASLCTEKLKAIILDKPSLSGSAEHASILAEELGHFQTNTFSHINENYNHPLYRQNVKKAEARAKDSAVLYAASHEEIQSALDHGIYEHWEIAEYCGVTVELITDAFSYYSRKNMPFQCKKDDFY